MAKSILFLEFTKQVSISTSVSVSIKMGSAGNVFPFLRAAPERVRKGEFEVVIPAPTSSQAAFSFASTWNKDYKDIGGINNLKASFQEVNGNPGVKITIENENWTFNSVNVNNVTSGEITFNYTNATAPSVKKFDHSINTGTCNFINYNITITGGTSPYTISGIPTGDKQVGNSGTFDLRRGTPANVRVTDSSGALVQLKTIVPPKKLDAANFTAKVTPENGWNTVRVTPNVILGSDFDPITYSLSGGTYQSTGTFTNLGFEANYTVSIKDGFGCVVTKTFVTLADTGASETQKPFIPAKISNGGTLIFAERQILGPETRRNPLNTNSCAEYENLSYSYVHEFLATDNIVQQFKSPYNFHKITLISNGMAFNIGALLQSENLNQLEKVDAKIFSTPTGTLGMYFDGGAVYAPNSVGVIGSSTYGTQTFGQPNFPSWANVGQVVEVESLGNQTIKRISTDSTRGLYIDFGSYYAGLEVDSKAQANYDKQDYNTYEFELPVSAVIKSGRVIIEMGFNNLVSQTFVSERIEVIEDNYKRAYIQWSDPLNKAGIVHQTGIRHFARLHIKLQHKPVDSSELYNGDSDVYNINQEVYTVAEFETAVFGFKMNQKLSIAMGMEDFYINGINYRKESMDSEAQGNSNIWLKKGVLRMGGNELVLGDEEIVLNPPSTPITTQPLPVPNTLAYNSGRLVLNGSGGFVIV